MSLPAGPARRLTDERKYLIIATALLSATAGLWFGMTTSNAVIIAMGVLITMSNNVFSSSFHVHQTELYPTSIRSSATGIAYALSLLSAAALPYGAPFGWTRRL